MGRNQFINTNFTKLITRIPKPTNGALAFVSRFIFWYHDATMINYEDPDGGGGGGGGVGGRSGSGVSVRTRKSEDGLETTSKLILRNAAPGDSGNYTCQPSNAGSASIHVFVSEGEFFSKFRGLSYKSLRFNHSEVSYGSP